MITSRLIQPSDYDKLSASLAADEFHRDTDLDFFLAPGSICTVYEEDSKPVLFTRGMPLILDGHRVIQMDIQFVDNKNYKANIQVMMTGFPSLADRAFKNGFTALMFESSHEPLRKFCMRRLGFDPLFGNWLIKIRPRMTDEDND
jgi:hypothetical protein